MKLTCLGTSTARCLLLTIRKTNILLDCGLWGCSGVLYKCDDPLDTGPPKYLLPLLQLLECYEVEAVLISTPEGMLALPHLLTACPGLIKGPIYATTAALDVAWHLVSELLPTSHAATSDSCTGAAAATGAGKRPMPSTTPTLMEVVQARCKDPFVFQSCWAAMYNLRAAEACFEQVKAVRFGQQVALDGYELHACPYPAGSGFGHAVWTITDGSRRIGYLSSFRLGTGGHALELEPQALLGLDVLITASGCVDSFRVPSVLDAPVAGAPPAVPRAQLPAQPQHTGLPLQALSPIHATPVLQQQQEQQQQAFSQLLINSVPPDATAVQQQQQDALKLEQHHPVLDNQQQQAVSQQVHQNQQRLVQQLKQAVLSAVTGGGSALIPLPSSGLAWDVLEAIAHTLQLTGLGGLLLLYISPCAQDSLALANTSMEFLSLQRQTRAYVPEPAFPFQELQASGRLILARNVEEAVTKRPGCLDQPCIAVASSASLVSGPASQLVRLWGQNPRCTLVLTKGMAHCSPSVVADAIRAIHPTLQMRVALCDLGAEADARQLALLLARLQQPPTQLVMSYVDAQHLDAMLKELRRSLAQGAPQVHTYHWMDVLSIKLPKHTTCVSVAPSLLQNTQWQVAQFDPKCTMAKLPGTVLHEQGRGWQLRPAPGQGRSRPLASATGSADTIRLASPIQAARSRRPTAKGVIIALQREGHEAFAASDTEQQGLQQQEVVSIPSLNAQIKLGDQEAKILSNEVWVREYLAEFVRGQLK